MLNTFIVSGCEFQAEKIANVARAIGLAAVEAEKRPSEKSYTIQPNNEEDLNEFRAVLGVMNTSQVEWCELASVNDGNDVMVVAKKDKNK